MTHRVETRFFPDDVNGPREGVPHYTGLTAMQTMHYWPTGPMGKDLCDEIQAEFELKPLTLKQQLKDLDEILAVEQNYLDAPEGDFGSVDDEDDLSAYERGETL